MQAASTAADRSTSARQVLQQRVRTADSAAVSSLWRQFRKGDREASGKLSSSEFAAALQSSKLGLSSAEVLQVTNGLADCDGLLDYRPVGQLLRSRVSADPTRQGGACAEATGKKPPLPWPGSSGPATRKSNGSNLTAKPVDHTAQRVAGSVSPAVASFSGATLQHVNSAGCGQDANSQSLPEAKQDGKEQQQAAQVVPCAALQQMPSAVASDRRSTGTTPACEVRPGTAPVKRSPGPPAQKVPYFFGKGQVDMQQPYQWKPSKDNTTVQDTASKGVYERPWSAGHTRNKLLQVSLL